MKCWYKEIQGARNGRGAGPGPGGRNVGHFPVDGTRPDDSVLSPGPVPPHLPPVPTRGTSVGTPRRSRRWRGTEGREVGH